MSTNRWIVGGTLTGLLVAGMGMAQAKKESNRQVIERWFETIDSKQVDKLAGVETADLEMKMPGGMVVKGSAGHAQMTKMFAAGFPNFKHTVSRCVESGETIACEGKWGGDHTGPFAMPNGQTVAATNKHVEFEWAGLATIKNGKVATVNVYFDNLGFLQQLGVIPPPPAHASR
jgi:ketosteroid isomerase-like protein